MFQLRAMGVSVTPVAPMNAGRVIFWNRRIGKIRASDSPIIEFLFAVEDLVDLLDVRLGQPILFDVVTTSRGPRATNVRPLPAPQT
jgi:hypothetical protein